MNLSQLSANDVLRSVSKDELQRWVNDYPYFAPGHFFLAAKLNEAGSSDAPQQLQRTALYFNNSYWLQYQLSNKKEDITILNNTYQQEETKPLIPHIVEDEIQHSINASKEVEEVVVALPREIDEQEEIVETAPIQIEEPIIVEEKAITIEEPIIEDIIVTEPAPIVEVTQEVEQTIEEPVQEASVEVTQPIAVEQLPIVEEVTPIETEAIIEQQITSEDKPIEATEPVEEHSAEVEEDALMNEVQAEKLSSVLDAQLAEYNKPVDAAAQLKIDSEPYHAVDYFASLGIKVDLDLPPHDRLTNQLRKFTDWLKHMKKVQSDDDNIIAVDADLETAIQGIAQTSNESRDVVTEAMAEILEKQGKKDKAIQLYIKLSFLNPDKSAYFADKIQQLKGI